jgi:RNA polymerase sigma-70 factor (ECF subfamily)
MDRHSFARAITEHKDAVFRYALYLLGSPEDAEDVAHDAFVAMWRDPTGVPEGAMRPWLLRVTRNACIDVMRRKKVRTRSEAAARVAEEMAWGPAAVREAADDPLLDVSDRGRAAVGMETGIALEQALAVVEQLPEPGRSVLVLREVEDLTYEEIARITEMTLSSVKVTLHRARKRLRTLLLEEGLIEP